MIAIGWQVVQVFGLIAPRDAYRQRMLVGMTSPPAPRSHEEAARVLRRAGYSDEFISEVLSQLPDPIDLQRDQQILARYGLTAERLMDRRGGSP
jgi:hypothetical protein